MIKAEELATLNYLGAGQPQPLIFEWINRGTDQKMRRSSVEMLLRTLSQDDVSPSVARLHHSAGLRVVFKTDEERDIFAAAFANAHAQIRIGKHQLIAAMFDEREIAEEVVAELTSVGIPECSISLLWRAGQYADVEGNGVQGHSKLSVAAATTGGGVAGAMLGVALLAVPSIGPVAAAGAVAASKFSSVAAVSAIIGATGGAMARMLSDPDVEGTEANYFEEQIRLGKVFVSVDTRVAEGQREIARRILMRNGGHEAAGVRLH